MDLKQIMIGGLLLAILAGLFLYNGFDSALAPYNLTWPTMIGIGLIIVVIAAMITGYIRGVPVAIVFIFAVILILLGTAGVGQAVSWEKIVDGNCDYFDGMDYSYQRNAVKLANGTYACAFVDIGNDEINLVHGSGTTWETAYYIGAQDLSVQICVERIPEFDYGIGDPREAIIIVFIAYEDPSELYYVIIDPQGWTSPMAFPRCIGDEISPWMNLTDPYVTVTSNSTIYLIWSNEFAPDGSYHLVYTYAAPVLDTEYPGQLTWAETDYALYVEEPGDERYPCLAVDKDDTIHLSYSTYIDDIPFAWYLKYANKTIDQVYWNYMMFVFADGMTDQLYGSLIVANVTYGGLPRDTVVVCWENITGFFESEVVGSGMWVGDSEFWDNPRFINNDSYMPSVGTWGNQIMVTYIKDDGYNLELYWSYATYPFTTVTTQKVPGQNMTQAYFYPSFIWSYWGGSDRYMIFVQQLPPPYLMQNVGPMYSPESDIYAVNLYTASAPPVHHVTPGGGGGGGGGGITPDNPPVKKTCCSSAALGIIAPLALITIVWRRKK